MREVKKKEVKAQGECGWVRQEEEVDGVSAQMQCHHYSFALTTSVTHLKQTEESFGDTDDDFKPFIYTFYLNNLLWYC